MDRESDIRESVVGIVNELGESQEILSLGCGHGALERALAEKDSMST